MIARINHEHAEREKLEQARQELLKRKQALIAENKKRKEDLASLDQDLERFIDVSAACWLVTLRSDPRALLIRRLTHLGRKTDPKDLRKGILISYGFISLMSIEMLVAGYFFDPVRCMIRYLYGID